MAQDMPIAQNDLMVSLREHTRAGASPKVLAQASAEEAGWAEFQRSAAWWLGEQGNPACTEFIGQEVHVPERSPDELPITGLSPGEVVALQVCSSKCSIKSFGFCGSR